MEMFPHVLSALAQEHREALLEEARRARLARCGVRSRRASRLLARMALFLGHALLALGARLQKAE
jgi:hypothetical protein